jgi:2,5-dihydroxypyridine 5,6-dioxygenase
MANNPVDSLVHLDRGAMALVGDYLAVKKGESVLITADTETDTAAVQAVFRAVRALCATPSLLTIPQVPYQGGLADPYLPSTLGPAAKSCDVWIDLTFPYLAGAHVYEEALATKRVRYFLGGDTGAGGIARLFGTVNLDEYFALYGKLEQFISDSVGKKARITDPIGTDVSFEIAKPGFLKPRRCEKPGSYLVPGSCTLFPVLESVCGTICFTAVFHEYFCHLSEPLVVKVDGKIQEVAGPAHHRLVLDRALRRAGNGEYGNIIHFTYGMNPAARMTGKSFIEDARALGNNAVGMGLPWWVPGGGENHPDGVVSNQSIWIDGEQIVRDGVLVGPKAVAELAHTLVPAVHGKTRPVEDGQPVPQPA